MAQSGFTPIILFNSGLTGHTPTTGNLAVGELAINYTDGIIFYNNGSIIKQFSPLNISSATILSSQSSSTIPGIIEVNGSGSTWGGLSIFSGIGGVNSTLNSTTATTEATAITNLQTFTNTIPVMTITNSTGAVTFPSLIASVQSSSSSAAIIEVNGSGSTWGGLGINTGPVGVSTEIFVTTGTTQAAVAAALSGISAINVGILITNSTGLCSFPNGIAPATTTGIKGTTAGDNANAGSIGEYPVPAFFSQFLTNGIVANGSSTLTLSAGDWDVWGWGSIQGSATSFTFMQFGLSTTSLTFGQEYWTYQPAASTSINAIRQSVPMIRVSSSSTITVYMVCLALFSAGTANAIGSIYARRRR